MHKNNSCLENIAVSQAKVISVLRIILVAQAKKAVKKIIAVAQTKIISLYKIIAAQMIQI